MKSILDTFNGISESNSTIIKRTDIDILKHKIGIGRIVKGFQPDFKNTEISTKIYHAFFQYFTGNHDSKLDLNKGIWLTGNTGSGKSLVFDVFKAYTSEIIKSNGFHCFDYESVLNRFKTHGIDSLSDLDVEFDSSLKVSRSNPVYIDDFLNVRSHVNHFQNYVNLAEEIISIRYRVYSKHNKLTHVSSNIHPEQSGLDSRILGRINEMFNIISFDDKNWRNSK